MGTLALSLTGAVTPIASRHDDVEGGLPAIHDQRVVVAETRLSVEYAFAKNWAVGVALPWRVVDADIRVLDSAGDELVPTPASPHHRDETLSGIGDPQLAVRWARGFAAGRTTVEARAGVTLPLGRTEDDPFVNESAPHQHIQFGTGTVNPILGAEATRRMTAPLAWRAGMWGSTQQGLYQSGSGYQPGDRYAAGLTAGSALGARRFDFSLALELHVETAERWRGVVHDDEGNAGRRDVLLGAGVSFAPTAAMRVFLAVRVPLHTDVVGAQLDYPFVAAIGFSGSFDMGGRKRKVAPAGPPAVADCDGHDADRL